MLALLAITFFKWSPRGRNEDVAPLFVALCNSLLCVFLFGSVSNTVPVVADTFHLDSYVERESCSSLVDYYADNSTQCILMMPDFSARNEAVA
jgi:hypothetical protein